MAKSKVGCTQILFSGNNWQVEKYMATRPQDFTEAGGVLLSFWYVMKSTRGTAAAKNPGSNNDHSRYKNILIQSSASAY